MFEQMIEQVDGKDNHTTLLWKTRAMFVMYCQGRTSHGHKKKKPHFYTHALHLHSYSIKHVLEGMFLL